MPNIDCQRPSGRSTPALAAVPMTMTPVSASKRLRKSPGTVILPLLRTRHWYCGPASGMNTMAATVA